MRRAWCVSETFHLSILHDGRPSVLTCASRASRCPPPTSVSTSRLAPRSTARIRAHGFHFRIPQSNKVVLQALHCWSGAIFFHHFGDRRGLRVPGVPYGIAGAEPLRF